MANKNPTATTIPNLHDTIRGMPARVKYLVNIYENKTRIDHHELETPILPVLKGDKITLWTNGPHELIVDEVVHRLHRDLTWLTQTVEIFCIPRS